MVAAVNRGRGGGSAVGLCGTGNPRSGTSHYRYNYALRIEYAGPAAGLRRFARENIKFRTWLEAGWVAREKDSGQNSRYIANRRTLQSS